MLKQLTLAMGLVAAMTTTGSAASVNGTDVTGADLNSSRSSASNQLTLTGSYNSASVTWNINYSTGIWHYAYTFAVTTNGNGQGTNIDHLVLQLSPDATNTSIGSLAGGTLVGVADTVLHSGLPQIYGATIQPLTGTKTLTISFESDRSPVWGNYFITSNSGTGGGNVVYNNGLADSSLTKEYFIARPDGSSGAVPEPSSIALLGCGALALVGYGRRRKASA